MGYRKSDNTNPQKLVERGVRAALRLGYIPGAKHLGTHITLSYERVVQIFGSLSAYQAQIHAALVAMGQDSPELRRGGASLRSHVDFPECIDAEEIGCNYGAVLSGPCACQWCEAYKTPARHCTCTSDKDQCAACRAYWHARKVASQVEAMRDQLYEVSATD